MIKLSLPCSDMFKDNKEFFLPFIDVIELKEKEDYLGYQKEYIFHSGDGIIDEKFIQNIASNGLLNYFQEKNINLFSFDFGPSCTKTEIKGYKYIPRSKILSKIEIQDLALERIEFIRDNFSGRIAVENLNYFSGGAYKHICEPNFISKFVTKSDVFLVLDLAHAAISAHNLGMGTLNYLAELPLGRVIEIHLSRPSIRNGTWLDSHLEPLEKEFRLLEYVLKHAKPEYITVEYYESAEKCLNIYRYLQTFLKT